MEKDRLKEFLPGIIQLMETMPENGQPEGSAEIGVAHALGFISEYEYVEPCKQCGTPKVRSRYFKITDAGRMLLAAWDYRIIGEHSNED